MRDAAFRRRKWFEARSVSGVVNAEKCRSIFDMYIVWSYMYINVGEAIINHPFGNGLYHVSDLRFGGWFMALFYLHTWCTSSMIGWVGSARSHVTWSTIPVPSFFPRASNLGPLSKNPPTPLWRWRRAYWAANSYTKCLITFVNIAVAISALAGGGAKTISHRDLGRVVFARFFDDFWVSELKRPLKRNFGSFWSASGKGKTDRNEKTL